MNRESCEAAGEAEEAVLVDAYNRGGGGGGELAAPWEYPQVLADVRGDAEVWARVREEARRAFVEETFWVPADAAFEPRCALEALAREIFEHWTKGTTFDRAKSGAEWWTQARGAKGKKRDAIRLHWDKSEALVDAAGLLVHPHVSTVTYMSDAGAPTLVVDHRAGTSDYTDVEAQRGPCSWVLWSKPRDGKHLAFDGTHLHGAPTLLRDDDAGDKPRVTFLCNVWLNHTPMDVAPFPDEEFDGRFQRLADGATPVAAVSTASRDHPTEVTCHSLAKTLKIPFGGSGSLHELRLPAACVPPDGESTHLVRLSCGGCGVFEPAVRRSPRHADRSSTDL